MTTVISQPTPVNTTKQEIFNPCDDYGFTMIEAPEVSHKNVAVVSGSRNPAEGLVEEPRSEQTIAERSVEQVEAPKYSTFQKVCGYGAMGALALAVGAGFLASNLTAAAAVTQGVQMVTGLGVHTGAMMPVAQCLLRNAETAIMLRNFVPGAGENIFSWKGLVNIGAEAKAMGDMAFESGAQIGGTLEWAVSKLYNAYYGIASEEIAEQAPSKKVSAQAEDSENTFEKVCGYMGAFLNVAGLYGNTLTQDLVGNVANSKLYMPEFVHSAVKGAAGYALKNPLLFMASRYVCPAGFKVSKSHGDIVKAAVKTKAAADSGYQAGVWAAKGLECAASYAKNYAASTYNSFMSNISYYTGAGAAAAA